MSGSLDSAQTSAPALPMRDGSTSVARLIDLYMATYAGRDTTRVQRLAWCSSKVGELHVDQVTDDHLHAALEDLATRHGRHWAGKDADGRAVFKAKARALAPATINRYHAAIGAVFTWAIRRRITPKGWDHPGRRIERRAENNENAVPERGRARAAPGGLQGFALAALVPAGAVGFNAAWWIRMRAQVAMRRVSRSTTAWISSASGSSCCAWPRRQRVAWRFSGKTQGHSLSRAKPSTFGQRPRRAQEKQASRSRSTLRKKSKMLMRCWPKLELLVRKWHSSLVRLILAPGRESPNTRCVSDGSVQRCTRIASRCLVCSCTTARTIETMVDGIA